MSGSWQVGQFAKLVGDNFDWQVIPNPAATQAAPASPAARF